MRRILLAVILVTGLLHSGNVGAQNIGVPQDKNSSSGSSILNFFMPRSTTSADAPKPDTTTQKSAETTTTPVPQLSNRLPSTPKPTSPQQTPIPKNNSIEATIYLPTSQQNMYIQNEQQNIQSYQSVLAALTKAQQASTAAASQSQTNMAAMAQSSEAKNLAPGMSMNSNQLQSYSIQSQNALAAQIDQVNAQLLTSQQRLAILQAGPVRMTDLARLYGAGQ